ncbi:hypothetical protein FOMG_14941 [Fusarium oxysporum f. sp. melonis 26406]|uniref:Beta-xylosidase C-terminal Concanavalin A-like domain-containing protein n=1 Tax=Fusarium oxysporum f. sp. melonis 26406 TaxID=1089452 RepID=W9ZAT4_FUSOX|nr:hypothetical protein FOMG_14941 [Fusarium oxysporum f. sp. melonis 26406]KAJ9414769.1 hypothetical protein QL093DRAFT_2107299 [Fusarium oxysporum]
METFSRTHRGNGTLYTSARRRRIATSSWESFLTTVSWPEGEHPVISTPARRNLDLPDVAYVHIRDPVEANYGLQRKSTEFTSSKADLSDPIKPVTFVEKHQRLLDGLASVALNSLAMSTTDGSRLQTGLCYYKDEHRYVRIFLDVDANEVVLQIINKARCTERRTSQSVGSVDKGAKITFDMNYTELDFVFLFSVDHNTTTRNGLGKIDSLDMTGHNLVGPLIGVYAVSEKEI